MCDIHPSAFKEEKRKARKEHICEECKLPIRPGTIYVYTSGIWDRRPDSYAQHVECRDLLLDHPDDEGCWQYGTLDEALTGDPEAQEEWARVKSRYATP
jgi:hypothetical protein